MNTAVLLIAATLNLTPGNFDVVVSPKYSGAVLFAMEEMTNFLSRAFGQPVSVKKKLDPSRPSIVLGTNEWSAAAGVDLSPLRRDGYLLKTKGNALYIAGLDDSVWLNQARERHDYLHGTLNGVYAFLEDFVGCRFYFPGELGEIVPHRDAVKVPELDRHDNPAMEERSYAYWSLGGWFDKDEPHSSWLANRSMVRLRFGSSHLIDCHGLRFFHYVPRFKETHPEYFQLLENGQRNLHDSGHSPHWKNGRLCFTSGVREEIYQDVKAYLTGQPASSRGLKNWGKPGNRACWGRLYVGIHPEDGYEPCHCKNCQAAYKKGDPSYASELIWGLTKEIAERLEKEGIKAVLLQSAYSAWSRVPDIDLPMTNILIDVATTGPWGTAADEVFAGDLQKLKAWTTKLGRPVLTWTYPGKYGMNGDYSDVPAVAPHAFAKYYQAVAKYISGPGAGTFAETCSDRWMFNMLNHYVLSRVTWNPSVDVDAILNEHYRLMYGPAAPHMKKFFEALEELWMKKMQGTVVNTSIGPQTKMPGSFRVWMDIYSVKRLNEFGKLFSKALAEVPAGSLEARRIELMKREFLDRLLRHAESVDDVYSVEKEKARRAAHPPKSVVVDFKPTTTVLDPKKNKTWKTVTFKTNMELGKSYRVSIFVKGENVKRCKKGGGAQAVARVCKGYKGAVFFPGWARGLDGTFDWVLLSGKIDVPKTLDAPFRPEIDLDLGDATGTVHFDGLVVEEIQK